jgi:4-hydroxy-tetrahydrodipicolinate synthase
MKGVIAAVATPLDRQGAPDHALFMEHARYLLANGCDGLNVLGTTGEATSFSVAQRIALMTAVATQLPTASMMVGTGAAALTDTVALTAAAADLGFAGALVLPPFYYKGIDDVGLFSFVDHLVAATRHNPIALYLYNFPVMTGIIWQATLVARLIAAFPDRIVGLKDSSGDLAYAREIASIDPTFKVFPSNEAILLEAGAGQFAGCISATANLNAAFCAQAFRHGDQVALNKAIAIRSLFNGKPLVAGIKAAIAQLGSNMAWANVVPPLSPWSDTDAEELADNIRRINVSGVAIG